MTKLKKRSDAGLLAKCGPAFLLVAAGITLLSIAFNHRISRSTSESLGIESATAGPSSSDPRQMSPAPSKHNLHQPISESQLAITAAQQNSYLMEIIGLIQNENDPVRREDLAALLIAEFAIHDIPTSLELIQSMAPADLAMDLTKRMLRRWVECAASDAAQWVNALPEGELRRVALLQVAEVWPNTSLAEATAWAASLANETERQHALLAVAHEAVRLQPIAALQIAVDFTPGEQRDDLICRAATEWATTDTENALQWAQQIPAPSLRKTVLAGEILSWADQDPHAAATFAVDAFEAGRLLDDLVISIVQRWAQQNLKATSDWVAQFPEGQLRTIAMANLALQWSQPNFSPIRH